jgi:ADP-heptose:LPS heptosyltransferase
LAENRLIASFLRPFFRKGKAASFTVPGMVGDRSRILAIDTGNLADALFHIPLLRGIRTQYPGARIDFLVPEEHAPLVVPSGMARNCLVYQPRQLKPWLPAFGALVRSVRKRGYDMAILMSLDPEPVLELVVLACGAALRFGPSHVHAFPAINFEVRAGGNGGYRGRRPSLAAPFFGLAPDALESAWPLPVDRLRQMNQLVHFNKPRKDEWLVGVDPGLGKAGHGISLENLRFLVRQLSSQTTCRILPLTDPDNQERMRRFEAQLGSSVPGLPRDTLLETVLLLAQCDLFVAGNSDLFHFAVAQGVPTLGIFTQRDGSEWEPAPRPTARVLRVTKGERVDIDTLMEAVETVVGARKRPRS